MRIILRDLYEWREPITPGNWRRLDAMIRERADDRLQYALEWGFFTRCQWGEFDTALYELERCWDLRPVYCSAPYWGD